MLVCNSDDCVNLVAFENPCRVRMSYNAGCWKMLCACAVILSSGSDAGRAPKRHAAGVSCQPKELTALTMGLVEKSLICFDEANGKHLGTWSPGFPELQVHENAPVDKSKVQCGLIFMAQGFGKILEDQRSHLNPRDFPLHKKLEETISRINLLRTCLKSVLGGECSPQPSPPKMPVHTFDRKQWSHTLLKAAWSYLQWLEQTFRAHNSKVKGAKGKNRKVTQPKHLTYLEGSGHLL